MGEAVSGKLVNSYIVNNRNHDVRPKNIEKFRKSFLSINQVSRSKGQYNWREAEVTPKINLN